MPDLEKATAVTEKSKGGNPSWGNKAEGTPTISGNYAGRPAVPKLVSDMFRKLWVEKTTYEGRVMTQGEAYCRAVLKEAHDGNPTAMQIVAERTEGKVPTQIVGKDEGPVTFTTTPQAAQAELLNKLCKPPGTEAVN